MQRNVIKLVSITAGILIILGGIIGYLSYKPGTQAPAADSLSQYQQSEEDYSNGVSDDFTQESSTTLETFVLKHPVTQPTDPTKKFGDVSISGYRRDTHELGSEFVFSVRGAPNDFNRPIETEVPDLKVRVSEISNSRVTLENLGEVGITGLSNPFIDDTTDIVIKDDVCVPIRPTALDVVYSYCFEIDTENGIPVVSYSIVSESTMPTP